MDLVAFGPGGSEGSAAQANSLGGKGAGLCEMSNIGVNVPAGVVISTSACISVMDRPKMEAITLSREASKGALERLNDGLAPGEMLPLLSVRSGARVSMPGMMDTILNVGITEENIDYWCAKLGPHGAYDSWRRLIQMYATVVDGVPASIFEGILKARREDEAVEFDRDISSYGLKVVVGLFLGAYEDKAKKMFPDTVDRQLSGAITAVWASWMGTRAVQYRALNGYPDDWGTAVTIQSMVFGNINDISCSGVMFTRNPETGEPGIFGEFLPKAQGEDVVAGIRTPFDIKVLAKITPDDPVMGGLENVYNNLCSVAQILEGHYRDMQDVEFTVQNGELFILQTRAAKRSAEAVFKVALELCNSGAITSSELQDRIGLRDYISAVSVRVAPGFNEPPDIVGIPASGGVVSGMVVFSSDEVMFATSECILIRPETVPEDIAGIAKSVGCLTITGGMTSHAAVVARGMNKACVVGAINLLLGEDELGFFGAIKREDGSVRSIRCGDQITIDGSTGKVWLKKVPIVSKSPQVVVDVLRMLGVGKDTSIIFKGMSEEDTFNNRILVPYSWYGVSKQSGFISDVKSLVMSGLEVFVTFDESLTPADTTVTRLVDQASWVTKSREVVSVFMRLQRENILSRISVISQKETVIASILTEFCPDAVLQEVDKVGACGGETEYTFINTVLVPLAQEDTVKTKYEFLSTILRGAAT